MSTPERDLEAYERDMARQDWLDAKLEREADEHEEHSCDYCGTDETTKWHVIKDGATVGVDGPKVDCHACVHCFAKLQREAFLSDLDALTDALVRLATSAPTPVLKRSVDRVNWYAKELIDQAIEHIE